MPPVVNTLGGGSREATGRVFGAEAGVGAEQNRPVRTAPGARRAAGAFPGSRTCRACRATPRFGVRSIGVDAEPYSRLHEGGFGVDEDTGSVDAG
ncbi:hypothetical protein [Embleya sp. MST-111070]|uniref:hypothetical protein n=1 Tax=Embleya sp. MST-111070 TaxID=3398231 RepID=UPI003F739D08